MNGGRERETDANRQGAGKMPEKKGGERRTAGEQEKEGSEG